MSESSATIDPTKAPAQHGGGAIRPVLAALSAVMSEVGSVKKDGKNDFHNYKYATAADVMHKLQPLMAKNGLTIVQHQTALEFIQDGAAMAIQYEFHVLHSSGDRLDLAAVHTGVAAARTSKGGPDDKAANKCHTAARKYFLLSLFQIPTGDYDDADADGEVPTASKPPVTPAEQKAVQKAVEQKPKGIFLALDANGGGTTHASVTAYLDALEGALSSADDPLALFDLNEASLQEQQAKAAKAKDNPQAQGIVARIADIFTRIHKGTIPGQKAAE